VRMAQMMNRASRYRLTSVVALTGSALLTLGTPAVAQDEGGETEQPPGYEEPEAPEIDETAAGLMLSDGATLAEPRVLDIKFVTEDLGGGEDTGSGGNGSSGGGGGEDPGGETPDGDGAGQREEYTSGQHKFTLQTDVLFAEGSDEISEEAQDSLAEVAAAIDEYHPPEVNIFGFTDDQGSYESGRALSDSRAQNAYEALQSLIENPDGILFNVRGYSEDYPLYDNSTEEGRQRNRRVEISWPTEE
jgi:outer membrane protein OmpA-like peptidoglycan-associated protein